MSGATRRGTGSAGRRGAALIAGFLLLAATGGVGTAAATDRDEADVPFSRQGYAGLAFRDLPDGHVIISWIFPGPLKGEGLESPSFDLGRPDLVVSLNGEPAASAADAKRKIRAMAPGDTLRLAIRRSNARGGAIPDTLDHSDEVREIRVPLASREEWSGTIGVTRGHDTRVEWSGERALDPDDRANVLGRALVEHDLGGALDTLRGVFTDELAKTTDYHDLSRVRAAFEDPFRLPELARVVTGPAVDVATDPIGTAVRLTSENLDAPAASLVPPGAHVRGAPDRTVIRAWTEADRAARRALGALSGDTSFAWRALAMLRVPHDTFYLSGDETREHTAVIRASMKVDFGELTAAVAALGPVAAAGEDALPLIATAGPPDVADTVAVPEALIGAVEGPLRAAFRDADGHWFVEGTAAANRYDLSRLAVVVDPGGDDEYVATDLALGTHVVVDLAGNDVYRGTDDLGAAAALLGVVLVDDRAGDDRYEGALLSTGAALFGAAILLDRAGNDTYSGSQWSIGAGVYGAGLVLDLGPGDDTYLGDFLCEGVGGPRGLGAIVDESGRELYRANGPTPSAYGTPAVFQSFSQGIGFGLRNYAAGGAGMICDLAGDDRYEAGEFAQGGAYYHSLGVLHDLEGRDLYYGNRYGQGFGVHQAMGALVDEAGDDTYWSMTAASQGAAWDVGAGLLLDAVGNDSYQCDGLGQGGAAQQAIAVLLDLDGADRYVAAPRSTQGESGDNTYHFDETGAYSLSVLIDLGSGEDGYSGDRRNDASLSPGETNDTAPARSKRYGLFVDR